MKAKASKEKTSTSRPGAAKVKQSVPKAARLVDSDAFSSAIAAKRPPHKPSPSSISRPSPGPSGFGKSSVIPQTTPAAVASASGLTRPSPPMPSPRVEAEKEPVEGGYRVKKLTFDNVVATHRGSADSSSIVGGTAEAIGTREPDVGSELAITCRPVDGVKPSLKK